MPAVLQVGRNFTKISNPVGGERRERKKRKRGDRGENNTKLGDSLELRDFALDLGLMPAVLQVGRKFTKISLVRDVVWTVSLLMRTPVPIFAKVDYEKNKIILIIIQELNTIK